MLSVCRQGPSVIQESCVSYTVKLSSDVLTVTKGFWLYSDTVSRLWSYEARLTVASSAFGFTVYVILSLAVTAMTASYIL